MPWRHRSCPSHARDGLPRTSQRYRLALPRAPQGALMGCPYAMTHSGYSLLSSQRTSLWGLLQTWQLFPSDQYPVPPCLAVLLCQTLAGPIRILKLHTWWRSSGLLPQCCRPAVRTVPLVFAGQPVNLTPARCGVIQPTSQRLPAALLYSRPVRSRCGGCFRLAVNLSELSPGVQVANSVLKDRAPELRSPCGALRSDTTNNTQVTHLGQIRPLFAGQTLFGYRLVHLKLHTDT